MTAINPKREAAFQANVAVLASNLTIIGNTSPQVCSTCHQPIDAPGCCTGPESKIAYPHGFHTISGGVGQAKS